MGLVRTIAGQALWRRPARTSFSICGIALGIATVVGVFTLDHNTVLGLSADSNPEWRPALEVRPATTLADPRGELEQTPGVAGVSTFFQDDVVVRTSPTANNEPSRATTERVRLFALDAASLPGLDVLRVVEGRTLTPASAEAELLIGEGVARELGVAVGDTLLLAQPPRAARAECIDGELRAVASDGDAPRAAARETPFKVVGVLAREKLGRRSQSMVVVADPGWARPIYAGARVNPVYWVRQDPNVDIERLRKSLGQSFSYDLNKKVIVGAAADERAFRNGVRMAGLFALALGLYVIFHTLSMSLVERVREVATLHALGTTRRQIARIFACEALVLAACAGVLGLGGGLWFAYELAQRGITTLGTGHVLHDYIVPWPSVLGLTALGMGIALVGSVWPLLRARGTSTVAALRGDEATRTSGVARGFHMFAAVLLAGLLPALYFVIVPVVGEAQQELIGAVLAAVGFLALLVTLPLLVPALLSRGCEWLARPLQRLWTFSGRMAAIGFRAAPARVAVSAAAIALVAAAFVGLKGMTHALSGEIEHWGTRALVHKVYVRGLPNVPFDELRLELTRDPNVLAIENGSARSYIPFLLLGQRISELAARGPLHDDPTLRARMERGDAVILSERLARHLDYAVGDRVHVSNASGAVKELEVVAISDAYGYFPHPDERLYGVTSDEFMRRAFCQDIATISECAIVMKDDADHDAVQALLAARYPEATFEVQSGRGLMQEHLIDLTRDFALFDLILGLTAALAALGVLNGQLLSAQERTKELGVLKALGTTRRQIAGMVLCEALVVGALGGVLGTLIGTVLTPVIVRALQSLSGLELRVVGAGAWTWIVPAGAVGLALVAALYPIARMNRTDAVAAVRAP